MAFFQDPPTLANCFSQDRFLKQYLHSQFPQSTYDEICLHLHRMGDLAANKMLTLATQAEHSPPTLTNFSPWGKRIDDIQTSSAWQELKVIAAKEGLIAVGHEKTYGWRSRLYQMTLLYLYHPSSAMYSCPLAMTDGAVTLLNRYGDENLKNHAIPHLTSRDPDHFWTSGQWMTEKTGGSDVSQTMTTATPTDQGFLLNGDKWFTSATTSQMAITLARTPYCEPGSKGLSLFYLELQTRDGSLNGIQIHRLKDKLGTNALPTAELSLVNAKAKLIGAPGGGVRKIAAMFNITRIYNSICAVASMRRALVLAKNYAKKRFAFGKPLNLQPLHCETLCQLEVRFRGAFLLTFYLVELLGKSEHLDQPTRERDLLRILTPICKVYTAKEAIGIVSEALECFGGAGYIEDTGIPVMLRNVQVLSIWEGTTNILSLDLLRAIQAPNALHLFSSQCEHWLKKVDLEALKPARDKIQLDLNRFQNQTEELLNLPRRVIEAGARRLAFAMARLCASCLLLVKGQEASGGTSKEEACWAAIRFCFAFHLESLFQSESELDLSQKLAQL